ncbi:hypothetical protein C2S53_018963 [Perilla frutescens var. hirtella]|uniref:GAG-pre-integrase domain-containing protein n=1 Tax=Perilla frutescens var. hirtella TaxID=608512 RepID=A0AAD4NYV6_PERFH|nr:hypothetical protein C2S53_018963 [Perilla frutescens var. hirtella]
MADDTPKKVVDVVPIRNSIDSDVIGMVTHCRTLKTLLESLEFLYSGIENISRMYAGCQEFYRPEKNDRSLIDYFMSFKRTYEELNMLLPLSTDVDVQRSQHDTLALMSFYGNILCTEPIALPLMSYSAFLSHSSINYGKAPSKGGGGRICMSHLPMLLLVVFLDLSMKKIIGKRCVSGDLYVLDSQIPKSVAYARSITPFDVHCRMGHPSLFILKKSFPQFSSLLSLDCYYEFKQYTQPVSHLGPPIARPVYVPPPPIIRLPVATPTPYTQSTPPVQPAIVMSIQACDVQCPICQTREDKLEQPLTDAISEEIVAEVEEAEMEITVTSEDANIVEELMEIQPCSKRKNDIHGALVVDDKELEQTSMEDLPSSNIIFQPISCDVFILHVVEEVPSVINLSPNLIWVPKLDCTMEFKWQTFDTSWKFKFQILKMCLVRIITQSFDGQFVFVFDPGGLNSRTNFFQHGGNVETVIKKTCQA